MSNIEALKTRIINGLDHCNNHWQTYKARNIELNSQFDKWVLTLQGLTTELNESGYKQCVFGQCKWSDNIHICFACSKKEERKNVNWN